MFALRKTEPQAGVAIQQTSSILTITRDDLVIEVKAAGICGTDLHIADWTPGYESMTSCMPVTLGHEFCGSVSDGPPEWRGKRIVGRPSVTCGQCDGCKSGSENHCCNRRGIGIHRDGAFASYVSVPARNCIVVEESLDAELAALTEPMTVAAQAITKAGDVAGRRVLIVGPGPIGLGAALFARRANASHITLVGKNDTARLDCAKSLGFDHRIDLGRTRLGKAEQSLCEIASETGLFDVVIEATGVPAVATQCQGILKPEGKLVICGIHSNPSSFDLTRLVRMEQTIIGSYRAPVENWPNVIDAIESDAENFRKLITHRLPLSAAMEGLELMRSRKAVKVILSP